MHFLILVLLLLNHFVKVSAEEQPCVFEGHLSTSHSWFGYLANVSVVNSGRMLFEFTYPADKCCVNVLFYSYQQITEMTPRMTCWQREFLLRPEKDQVMRLTPKFSWSGCYISHSSSQLMYTCEGGRSFAEDDSAGDYSSWYIAASNCATRSGIELDYRLTIYGFIGECDYQFRALSSLDMAQRAYGAPRVAGRLGDTTFSSKWAGAFQDDAAPCIVEGAIDSDVSWYGFVVNLSLRRGGGFKYHIEFPVLPNRPLSSQSVSLVFYTPDDIARLSEKMTCWQRYALIRQRYLSEQVIELSARSSWNGCASDNSTVGGQLVVNCRSERRFDQQRVFHVAIMNCRNSGSGSSISSQGSSGIKAALRVKYQFSIYGYDSTQVCCACKLVAILQSQLAVFLCISVTTVFK